MSDEGGDCQQRMERNHLGLCKLEFMSGWTNRWNMLKIRYQFGRQVEFRRDS